MNRDEEIERLRRELNEAKRLIELRETKRVIQVLEILKVDYRTKRFSGLDAPKTWSDVISYLNILVQKYTNLKEENDSLLRENRSLRNKLKPMKQRIEEILKL